MSRGLAPLVASLAVMAGVLPATGSAQTAGRDADQVLTAAGARYDADGLHRWLLGPHHRDVWAEPVGVEILSLDTMAGGLEPVKTGGGMQTRSLRLLGGDGREYTFRSVDKDPSAILDPVFRGTVLDDIVQDGISAAHPFAPLVVSPLLDAAGVLHAEPHLRVMPDHPSLGPFRAEFAGMLGLIEERPDENGGGSEAFAGAQKIIGSEKLTERLLESPDDRVDPRAYLRARLMDVFIGDWDRHRDQWRWATYDVDEPRRWIPVPRDRDQAFSDFDGVANAVARVYVPQLVTFGPEYPSMVRLHWNGRAIDRWFLAGLDREAWDEVGGELVEALTDGVIDGAVLHLPPEIHALGGAELASILKARRDGLQAASDELYRLMAEDVDIRATDADDVVEIRAGPDGAVQVSIHGPGDDDGSPWFRRRFRPDETREVRIHLMDGDDEVVFSGGEGNGPTIRVVGGAGDDRFHVRGPAEDVHLYDHQGNDVVVGEDPPGLDRRPFDPWSWTPEDRDQPRDWGRRTVPTFWSSYTSDAGVFVGGGARLERYGFRNHPYASAVELRAGVAPGLGTGRIELEAVVNRPASPVFWTAAIRLSGMDVLHYYGLGNATAPGDESFHRVELGRASVSAGVGVSPGPWMELTALVGLQRSATRSDPARFLSGLGDVYGDGGFTTLELAGRLVVDPFEGSAFTPHRLRLTVDGAFHPAALDAGSAFGRVGGTLSTLLASSDRPRISLAARLGAKQILGRFPWHEAAFLGGQETVRGWNDQRFAGDASVHAGGELRIRLARPTVVVPADLGVFGFSDTGRVWVDGSSPGGWHTGVGGGIYVRPAGQPYLARIGAATTEEATKLFVTVGLPY